VTEIAANRSPIGNATIFLIHTSFRERSPERHATSARRRRLARSGPGAGSTSSPASGSTTAPPRRGPSSGSSSGGCAVAANTSRRTAGNAESTAWRVVWSARAAAARSHTGPPLRLAPIASPAYTMYSLLRSNIESSHAPKRENVRV
jgi:hypothetical protein